MPHLGFEADGKGFFGELLHEGRVFRKCWAKCGVSDGWSGKRAAEPGFSGRPRRPRPRFCGPRARSADRPEALEITKFYHGVVLPRQSIGHPAGNRCFSLRRENPCAIFVREITHLTPEPRCLAPKIASS